jgi:excisionase family DNA binding protein
MKVKKSVQEIKTNRAVITCKEFAEAWGISEITARRWCYSGKIKSVKIGRSLRIPISELEIK